MLYTWPAAACLASFKKFDRINWVIVGKTLNPGISTPVLEVIGPSKNYF